MSAIDDLPPEMIWKLFGYLQPRDLIVCSMVCKLWRSLYSSYKIHRLAVMDSLGQFIYEHGAVDYCNLIKWSYPDRRIEDQELCQLITFRRLVDQPLLSNLKHLALSGLWFSLNGLSRVLTNSQLVHLEFNIASLDDVELDLKLPKLQVLAFHYPNKHCSLSLDCPELRVLLYLEYRDVNLLKVKHPETIWTLETNMFGEKLTPFKNVECLVAKRVESISKATLLSLPRLKELHCNESISSINNIFRGISIQDVLHNVREFLNNVRELKGADFQFQFSGFRMSEAMLDKLDFGSRWNLVNEWVYLRNYQLIESEGAFSFINSVDYSALMKNAIGGELPSCFSRKFTGIQHVRTGRVQDPVHFLRFLKSLSLLRSLILDQSGLGQEFYEQLPASAPSLRELILGVEEDHKLERNYAYKLNFKLECKLNFAFIIHCSCLSRFSTESELSTKSLASLLGCLSKSKSNFEFRFRGHSNFVSKKEGSKRYEVLRKGLVVLKTEKPNEILNFFQYHC